MEFLISRWIELLYTRTSLPVAQIEQITGLSDYYVMKHLDAAGVPRRDRKHQWRDSDERKLAHALHEQGVPVPEIADELGIDPAVLYRHFRNDGQAHPPRSAARPTVMAEEVVAAYLADPQATYNSIAVQFDVSRKTVYRAVRAAGVSRPGGRRTGGSARVPEPSSHRGRRTAPETEEQVVALTLTGMTRAEVSDELEVPERTIIRILQRHQVSRPEAHDHRRDMAAALVLGHDWLPQKVATLIGVSRSTVDRWRREWQDAHPGVHSPRWPYWRGSRRPYLPDRLEIEPNGKAYYRPRPDPFMGQSCLLPDADQMRLEHLVVVHAQQHQGEGADSSGAGEGPGDDLGSAVGRFVDDLLHGKTP